MENSAKLYVVHCIDTEGPLYESLLETFERIKDMTGITVEPSLENLRRIQEGSFQLNGYETLAAKVFSARFLDYNKNWADIEMMLDILTDRNYRLKYRDSFDNGWQYSWFIMDWIDFKINPRCRDLGYHNVYDHYQEYYHLHNIDKDEFQWHAHPMTIYQEAHKCATSYINSPHIFESLSRRLIDRGCFPNAVRMGFDSERPDSHWFLEQYIPYDFTNQALASTKLDLQQTDVNNGRFGDWRRAIANWDSYHPAHDDYQVPGSCNRVIFRCLNIGTRMRVLSQNEVETAFARVAQGQDTILAFADHDWRNMRPDVDEVYSMLLEASKKYPNVQWINSTASEAAKAVLKEKQEPINLSVKVVSESKTTKLIVKTDRDSFGPQPFLAFKMKCGRYVMENFDFQVPRREWSYTFDGNSIYFDDVEKIGVATNSLLGSGMLCVLDINDNTIYERRW